MCETRPEAPKPTPTPWSHEAWALLLLASLLLAALLPALLAGKLLAPADGLGAYLPYRMVAAAAWWQGELPSWNPFLFGGMPLLGAMQAGVLFPGNWPFLCFPPALAMNLTVAGAYAFALGGAYALGRSMGLKAAAAAFAALPFGLGGWMMGHLEHVAMVQAAACWPWLLWALHRHAQAASLRAACGAALALAGMILAGHPQTAILGATYAIAFALHLGPAPGWNWPRWLLRLAQMASLGLALAAPQIAPALAAIAQSQRVALPYAVLAEHALPLKSILAAWFPFFYGSPGDPLGQGPLPYWGPGPFGGELSAHVGLASLAMVALALSRWKSLGLLRFWALAGVVAWLLALGPLTPLHPLLSQLPGFDGLRVPARHLMVCSLAVGLLGGWAWQNLAQGAWNWRWRSLAAGVLMGPLLAGMLTLLLGRANLAARWGPFAPATVNLAEALSPFFWPSLAALGLGVAVAMALLGAQARPRLASQSLWALLALDLLLFAWLEGWAFVAPMASMVPRQLPQAPVAGRWMSMADGLYPYLRPELAVALPAPGLALFHQHAEALGYDPMVPARHARLLGQSNHAGKLGEAASLLSPKAPLLSLLGVESLHLTSAQAIQWQEHLKQSGWTKVPNASSVGVTLHRAAYPMAWWVPHATQVEPQRADDYLLGRGSGVWNPANLVLLDATPDELNSPFWSRKPDASGPKQPIPVATLRPRGMGQMAFQGQSQAPGWVVVSEAHDAGWRAQVNGKSVALWRANAMLMAIQVPAGTWQLRMRHTPTGGAWPYGVALGALVWMLWPRKLRRPRAPGAAPS